MVCSSHIILTLYGIAVFAIVRRSRRLREIPRRKDMISELPDDVLVSIITRMKVKDSIKTSILSKRWRNLHKSVPEIELLCRDMVYSSSWFSCLYSSCFSSLYSFWFSRPAPHDSCLIIKRVDRFFRVRSGSGSKIRSFSFRCCLNKLHTNRFEQWIRCLGTMGVEELVLQLRCPYYRYSDLSFNCGLISEMPSLKSLKLASCCLHPINMTSTTQCNKSLKILILHSVNLLPGSLECILSNCLSLHTLAMNYCKFQSNSKLFIRGPSLQLKSLYMTYCEGIKEIEFYASNLTTFEIQDYWFHTFVFDHVPRLQSIYISSCLECILPFLLRGELAKDLPQLKSLTFATRSWHAEEIHSIGMGIHTFRNLKHLELRFSFAEKYMNLLSLTPFLQTCPFLQELHLNTNNVQYSGAAVEKKAIVIHKELKKVEISAFSGTENELEFALYILKSAVNLELMHISSCPKVYMGFGSWSHFGPMMYSPLDEAMKQTIHKQLEGQAISKTAQIIVQHAPLYEEDKCGRSSADYDTSTFRDLWEGFNSFGKK